MSRFKDKNRPRIPGKGLKIGIVVGRFNEDIGRRLLKGALRGLAEGGVSSRDVKIVWVPGAFEIPLMLQKLARKKKSDALIALGCVIRGGTPHFDYVAGEASRGIMKVSLQEGIPVAFGLLTTNTVKQAMDRAGGRHGNKGTDAALAAVEMARLVKDGF